MTKKMYRKIVIEFIDYSDQRYDTVGDYFEVGNEIHFRISRMADPATSYLILFHELWEKMRNMQMGIPDSVIDKFDMAHPDEDPGSLPDSPYHEQHMEALALEKKMCKMLGVSFRQHENAIWDYCEQHPYPTEE